MFSLVNTDYCVAWMLQKVACVIACVSKDQLEPVMQTGRYEPYMKRELVVQCQVVKQSPIRVWTVLRISLRVFLSVSPIETQYLQSTRETNKKVSKWAFCRRSMDLFWALEYWNTHRSSMIEQCAYTAERWNVSNSVHICFGRREMIWRVIGPLSKRIGNVHWCGLEAADRTRETLWHCDSYTVIYTARFTMLEDSPNSAIWRTRWRVKAPVSMVTHRTRAMTKSPEVQITRENGRASFREKTLLQEGPPPKDLLASFSPRVLCIDKQSSF